MEPRTTRARRRLAPLQPDSSSAAPPQPDSSAAAAINWLDLLPDEILIHVARYALVNEAKRWMPPPISTCGLYFHLRATSKSAHARLTPLWSELQRLVLSPMLSKDVILANEFTVRAHSQVLKRNAWACSGILPTAGRWCWTVRCWWTNEAAFCLGVCTADGRCAWGLHVGRGHMRRWSRDANGKVGGAPTPKGFPNGHLKHVLYYDDGAKFGFEREPAEMLTLCPIDVVFDADAGTLGYRVHQWGVDGGPGRLHAALSGFPRGEALRPWMRLGGSQDRLTLRMTMDQ